MNARAGPAAPPIPTAASFNTERDLKGVRPGRTLEHRAQLESRRSSFAEVSSKGITEEEETVNMEEDEGIALPDEPQAPKPGRRSNALSGILQSPKQPVILTSKPVFSNLYKKRNDENGNEG